MPNDPHHNTPLRLRLQALLERWPLLEEQVATELLGALHAQRRPAAYVVEELQTTLAEYDTLWAELASHLADVAPTDSLPELLAKLDVHEAQASWIAFVQDARTVLAWALRVRIPEGFDPQPLAEMHRRANESLTALPDRGGSVEEWQPRVQPFHAFRRLLEASPPLDDAEADACTECVAHAFGGKLLRSHYFRQLYLDGVETPAAIPSVEVVPPAPPTRVVPVAPTPRPTATATASTESKRNFTKSLMLQKSLAQSLPKPAKKGPAQPVQPKPNKEVNATPPVAVPTPPSPPRAELPVAEHAPTEAEPLLQHVKQATLTAVPHLPTHLQDFASFVATTWLNPLTGHCEPAPWTHDNFAPRVEEAFTHVLTDVVNGTWNRLAVGYFLARYLQAHERAIITMETIRDIAAIYAEPTRTSVGRDGTRMERLRYAISDEERQLNLVLEALRPNPTELLYGDEIDQYVEAAHFRDKTLEAVVAGLLKHHTQSEADPTAQIRAELSKQPPPDTDWGAKLLKLQQTVQQEVKRVTLNAGSAYVGGFSHCAKAWTEFMTNYVLPIATPMYPDRPEGWDYHATERRIGQLTHEHAEIAERWEAGAKARRMMNRVAQRLAELLGETNDAFRQLQKNQTPERFTLVELEIPRRLLEGPRSMHLGERLAHALLVRAFNPEATPQTSPLVLHADFFMTYPTLVDDLEEPIDINNPPLAFDLDGANEVLAATLLYPHAHGLVTPTWRDVELDMYNAKRYDRVGRFLGELPTGDHTPAAHETQRRAFETERRLARLRQLWRDLELLGLPSHKENQAVLKWAERFANEQHEPRLVWEWLDQVTRESEEQLNLARQAWDEFLAQDEADVLRLLALRQGDYALAVRGGHGVAQETHMARETAWRGEAQNIFPNPRETLHKQAEKGSKIAEKWVCDVHEKTHHSNFVSLVTEFSRWIFSGEKTYERDDLCCTFEAKQLRLLLAPHQPTYLPQLHAARYLRIVVLNEASGEADYAQHVVEMAAKWGDNAIVVLLCPLMTATVREQIRRRLHKSNLFASTIDDLDVCRLLNPEGVAPNRMIGLLEIVLEQQPWKARNPFLAGEGSEMRLEMYVGRREEAEQLATTSVKTRLFSGRKLGKTALLKFIRQTKNGNALPNGRHLRVIYVSIVGVSADDLFAKKVVAQLRNDFPDVALPTQTQGPERLFEALRIILQHHPQQELLIVLDEADEFVLKQLDEYERRKEACLSFQLREPLTLPGDAATRVRYVFTGYRATATREGVWTNWGDVLELPQLSPEEAASLIAGPLARMGIDGRAQAAEIAFRCGYQPAVLLRFGERLVERLAEEGYQDGKIIDLHLVQDIFDDAKVQAEIRGVVWANFQGNHLGQAVFAAILQQSAKVVGHRLQNLEQVIRDQFREIGNFQEEADLIGLINAQLRDMVRRKLLLRRMANGEAEYQLKFTHHLSSLLLDLDLGTEIRTNLRAWQESSGTNIPATEGRSLLRRMDFANVREMLRPENAELAPNVVVIGSLWPNALEREPGGIPDRLELATDTPIADHERMGTEGRYWKKAERHDLERVVQIPTDHLLTRPVVLLGGLDLLRAGLERQRCHDPVEALGPHRMTDGQIRWWFQRIVGVEFASTQMLSDIHADTQGIPFLVGEFERELLPAGPPEGGGNFSSEQTHAARQRLQEHLKSQAFASQLFDQLTPREMEFLRMARVIGMTFNEESGPIGDWLARGWHPENFGQRWDQAYPTLAFPLPYLGDPADPVAIDVLVLSGLLPARDGTGEAIDRARALTAKDPLATLLATRG